MTDRGHDGGIFSVPIQAHVQCRLPASGEYRVALFASGDPLAPHAYVGEVAVLARL